jgi:hypothetical protein
LSSHLLLTNCVCLGCRWSLQGSDGKDDELILRDMEVFLPKGKQDATSREFLTAMQIAKKSQLVGKTASYVGLTRRPGTVLVSIERPTSTMPDDTEVKKSPVVFSMISGGSVGVPDDIDEILSVHTKENLLTSVELDEPLKEGDILWFAGSASAVGELRKIPGLISFESDEVKKMKEVGSYFMQLHTCKVFRSLNPAICRFTECL